MKKQLIGAFVGGLILFFWQFISFGPGNIHSSQMQHMPQQEAILQALADNNVSEGEYFLPRLPLDASGEAQEKMAQDTEGKPWGRIQYHKAYELSFGSNLARGFLIDFLAVFFLIWILVRMKDLDMKTTVLTSLAVGAIGYLTITYLDTVWFKTTSIPVLIDTVVQWGLVGAWLGWWLNRD